MEQYDVLILNPPTGFWRNGEDWEAVCEQLDDLNLEGKIVALYGMGDQPATASGSGCCVA